MQLVRRKLCAGMQTVLLPQDFASGFMFGQLMQTYGMQPDFEKFDPKRSPDAMVNNYTRLQASTMHSYTLMQSNWTLEVALPHRQASKDWASSLTRAQPIL